ncbi:hypothetical protein EJ02DRAFT_467330 [Clathrospora elynae]|uniref:Uncharacterized protein n=1 Tax=Clathrospora elynae TaxID=706981 RepID=A0A6A5SLE1_9PLEO|nr:hypothetical protein EJ02DRAFT_467330 [Clathrospora elynae]
MYPYTTITPQNCQKSVANDIEALIAKRYPEHVEGVAAARQKKAQAAAAEKMKQATAAAAAEHKRQQEEEAAAAEQRFQEAAASWRLRFAQNAKIATEKQEEATATPQQTPAAAAFEEDYQRNATWSCATPLLGASCQKVSTDFALPPATNEHWESAAASLPWFFTPNVVHFSTGKDLYQENPLTESVFWSPENNADPVQEVSSQVEEPWWIASPGLVEILRRFDPQARVDAMPRRNELEIALWAHANVILAEMREGGRAQRKDSGATAGEPSRCQE